MIKDVSIEIIHKCLNECVHCSSCSTADSCMMMSFEVIQRVVHGLARLNVKRICLSGGEPLLHPDIVKIVRLIADNNMVADVYTSGIIGEQDEPASLSVELLTQLKLANLRSVMFNVQSPDEDVYDKITKSNGHFPLLKESIKNANICGLRTEIHFVPMSLNLSAAEKILVFAENTGVKQVNYLKLVPHGRALINQNRIMLGDEDIVNLQNRLVNLKERGKPIRIGLPLSSNESKHPCHAVCEKLYIKFDGSVFGCEAFKYITFTDTSGCEVIPDNIYEKEIDDIFVKSSYLKLSKQLVKRYWEKKIGCENCPVQKYIKDRECE